MAEKRKRGQNFTMDEKDKLVKLVYAYRNVILNKRTDGTTNQAKNEAWINLSTQYNSTGIMHRSKDALIRVWEKMKSEAKIYNSRNKSCTTGTGGGPSTSKTDPILEQVCDLMGRGCTGIADVLDSDTVITMPIDTKVADLEVVDEEMQTLILNADLVIDKLEINEEENKEINTPTCSKIPATPLWKRRRPILKEQNQQNKTKVLATLCSGFQGMNKKKIEIEDLKTKLLEEEIEFKRKLYDLQLESARKDLEIKVEVLNQIKGGNFNLKNLFGVPKSNE